MQADLRVHGGLEKAAYVYAPEHYDFWRAQLPGSELPPGSFGENLTIAG
jgi:MOSC domain-containing protein YiiM